MALDVRRGIGHGRGRSADAEVRDLDVAVASDHHVARLEVAVGQPAIVSGLERPRNLGRGFGGAPRRDRSVALQERRQVRAVDVFGHEVGAGGIRTEVVDRGDVLVIETGRHPGLPAEVGHEVGVSGEFRTQQLDRDVVSLEEVARPIDGREAAFSEQLHQPVAAPDGLSDLDHEIPLEPGATSGLCPLPLDCRTPG